ncbi:MAG TPA: hydroxymethylglutaryl-CoA lyase [Flavobacteriales bacterium]|nr:hydroxymethylglutaryl-CoA lyase [Flavobacteriales bacterium]HRJ36696.1 hydroxymethylglutaryl-CoA lyase [Flavobacteriales bacterium]HRJ40212.1 hydroxymethylglutaryl-CoA lyase [Flavobacteriales bacterium]
MNSQVKLIECPRDAMQGLKEFVPTEKKIHYINQILRCGFDTVDFGSFVSPKAIPQMADTEEVLAGLDLASTSSKLLAIVANVRGAEDACKHAVISYLGFPFSISETFQQRNTNSGIAESLERVKEIQNLCIKHNKELVVYISMAFGNPYGDVWNSDIAIDWCRKLNEEVGVKILALSDTIGISAPDNIDYLFRSLIPALPKVEFGAHLHTTPGTWKEKIDAAWKAGCRRFDGAIKGYGGCPMAKDELTGNMPMENLLSYFKEIGMNSGINEEAFSSAYSGSSEIFH